MKAEMIYLDNAATTKPLPCAIRAFNRVLKKCYGNPHSAHSFGMEANKILEQSRETIARCVGAKPSEVYFTSGATEACNWALRILQKHCSCFMTNGSEHAAVSETLKCLPRLGDRPKKTHEYAYIVTLVNNETGKVATLPEGEHENDLIFADATAAVGNNMTIDFDGSGIDYMAFGAHKFGGIPGIGVLLIRDSAPVEPLIFGGGAEQRAGTPAVALAAAMAAALEQQTRTVEKCAQKIGKMRMAMINELRKGLDGVVLERNFLQVGNILSLTFRGVENTALVAMMSERFGTMISAGAACNSGNMDSVLVLMAQGYTAEDAESTVRISLSAEQNSVRQCRKVAKHLKSCVEHLRNL